MKNLQYSNIPSAFLLVFVIIILSCSKESNENKDNRKINSNTLSNAEHLFKIDDSFPIRAWGNRNKFYISLAPQNHVKEYDANGKQTKIYGRSTENMKYDGTIWHFSLSEKDAFWIHDYSTSQLKEYRIKDDSLINSNMIQTKNNVFFIDDDKFLIPIPDTINNGFKISLYNAKTKKYEKDLTLTEISNAPSVKNPDFYSYIFQGDFVKIDTTNIIYYCTNASTYFKINLTDWKATLYSEFRNLKIPNIKIQYAAIKL